MIVAVTGAGGQVGRELCRQGERLGFALRAFTRESLDITDPEAVAATLAACGAAVLINAAAHTDVDGAEDDPQTAFAVNRDGAANLAAACASRQIPLIHLSTDYVFDGKLRRPYTEADPPNPLQVYGASKAAGEERVRVLHPAHLIIRTSWVYSNSGKNFLTTMLHLGRQREEIEVVADQYGTPTAAADLAKAIYHFVSGYARDGHLPWGTYHYSGAGVTSWHGFATEIFAQARQWTDLRVRHLRPIPTARYSRRARRPAYSVLACDKVISTFGIRPRPWEDALAAVVREVFAGT